jgi:hypothetical protein
LLNALLAARNDGTTFLANCERPAELTHED